MRQQKKKSMKQVPSCQEYLTSLTDVGKNFLSVAEVKLRSIINACQENPDLSNDSFLVIGQNIIPFALNARGADVTKLHGLPYYGETPCSCKVHDGELEQKQMLSMISKIARKGFFTTVKDYKNMYANQRYFEEPFTLRTDTGDAILIRKREWLQQDRQAWMQQNYIIHNQELIGCGPYKRRTMYFKQLAKFTSDLGATSFAVEKQNMYKPAFSKTFEYVVCVKF